MFSYINIIGFLVLAYTVYLIVSEGSKKNSNSSTDNAEQINSNANIHEEPVKSKEVRRETTKNSVPVQRIEDEADVLRQGKTYSEQVSMEDHNTSPQPQMNVSSNYDMPIPNQARSSKYQDIPMQDTTTTNEVVSVTCPYCDNKVLVPKGGSAECSCCSSILNDNGGIMD